MNTSEDLDRAREQAKAQLSSIVDMVTALDTDNEPDLEEAQQLIQTPYPFKCERGGIAQVMIALT